MEITKADEFSTFLLYQMDFRRYIIVIIFIKLCISTFINQLVNYDLAIDYQYLS